MLNDPICGYENNLLSFDSMDRESRYQLTADNMHLFFFNIYLFIWQRPVLAGACMIFVATFQILVVVCGVQFPHQGLNPGLLYWEQGVLTTALLRSTPPPFFFNWLIYLAMAYLSLHLLKNMHHRWAQPSKKYLLQFILNIWLTFLKLRLVCVFC